MKRLSNIFFCLFLAASILWVFREWIFSPVLTGGDFWYYFPSMFATVSSFQFGWIPEANYGLGGVASVYQPIHFIFALPIYLFANFLHMPWDTVVKVGFFFPYLIGGVLAPFLLIRKVFPKLTKSISLVASFLFIFNSYLLLLVGGGQINLANACILGLVLLYLLIKFYEKLNSSFREILLRSIVLGFTIATITLWDIRFAYITLFAYVVFLVIFLRKENFISTAIRSFVFFLFIPGMIAALLNAFWIVPVVFLRQNPIQQLGAMYSTDAAVKFFSFAKLENAFGLLHPNWPENFFGLTHFMRPEFLLLPLLAFASLLFLKPFNALRSNEERKEQLYMLFFALIGLIGIFLAKGANDPFGNMYLWLFDHVPGFILFRDSSKWYFLVVISYCMLIPFSIDKIANTLKNRIKRNLLMPELITFLSIVYVLFLVRPVFLGELGRTFSYHNIPNEYKQLEKFLSSQSTFSRTLWVPAAQRYGLNSTAHPSISAEDFLHVASTSGVLDILRKKDTERLLQESAVKYVIVPYDSEKEIFLKDRKYDNVQRQQAIESLQKLSWLTEIPGFGRVAVFTVPNPKDHFFLLENGSASYTFINPAEYKVELKNVAKGERLVFSETYDVHWTANIEKQEVASLRLGGLNSFILPEDGNYTFFVHFVPQKYVETGMKISIATLFAIFITLLFIALHRKIMRKLTT